MLRPLASSFFRSFLLFLNSRRSEQWKIVLVTRNRTGSTIDSVYSIPVWLKANNYRTPTNGTKCPLNMGYKTDLHFFEFLNANPNYPNLAGQFNNFMSAYHQGRPSWMDDGFYPVADQLIKGAKQGDDEVLLVDVGGGKGHDLQEFRLKWPDAAGRLILQDQQAVLDEIVELESSIERTAHDFFTEQPVKGEDMSSSAGHLRHLKWLS